jgi:hypothetical protein
MVPVVWFSVSNRDQITLHLRPFPFDMITPIWALTLIELFIGFLLGAIVTWIADRHRRRDTRQLARRASELEQSLAAARQQSGELEKKLGELRAQPTSPVIG